MFNKLKAIYQVGLSNLSVVPIYFLTGIVIGFEYGQFYKVISDCLPNIEEEDVNKKTLTVFLFVGVG